MIQKTVLTCIVFWCTGSLAQNKCGTGDTAAVPGAIFGPDRILATGRDTLHTPKGRQLTYSCREGRIVCTDSRHHVLWTTGPVGRLIYFEWCPAKKIKGCDVVLQYDDKRTFVLNSKNGHVKPVSESDVILSLPKVGSRKDRKRMYKDATGPFRKT